eukprot:7294201-Prymnesium_polylepis.1
MTTLEGEDKDIHAHFLVRSHACVLAFPSAAKQPCVSRNLTLWSTEQKSAYQKVAKRFQEESAAYYSLLALGVVGSVKLAQFQRSLQVTSSERGPPRNEDCEH